MGHEIIDIMSDDYSYLDSDDDWLNPNRGMYPPHVQNLDIHKWIHGTFVLRSSNGNNHHTPPDAMRMPRGISGNATITKRAFPKDFAKLLHKNSNGQETTTTSSGMVVCPAVPPPMDMSPTESNIPQPFTRVERTRTFTRKRIINSGTITKSTAGVGVKRTDTFRMRPSVVNGFI